MALIVSLISNMARLMILFLNQACAAEYFVCIAMLSLAMSPCLRDLIITLLLVKLMYRCLFLNSELSACYEFDKFASESFYKSLKLWKNQNIAFTKVSKIHEVHENLVP